MLIDAHVSCTDTVRESALEVDSGRKIPCRTGDWNPRQYSAWHFSRTLYQLSYPHPNNLLLVLLLCAASSVIRRWRN